MPNLSEIGAAAGRIEVALTRAARSCTVPDYFSFQSFMAPHLKQERDARVTKIHADVAPFAAASMMLLTRYHQRVADGRPSPMDFRRYKLLRSLYADNGRSQQVADAFLYGSLPPDPTLDADEASPAVLRMRLVVAIQNGEFEDANFLLGQLDEVDHDAGERAYLQALVSFASGKLERTIKLVEGVPADAIDRPRAAWLAVKASALLGDTVAAERLLAEIADRLTPSAWLHLIELPNPTEQGEELAVFADRLPSALVLEPSDPAYDEWALYHVQMMGRFIAREREILEASEATSDIPSDDAIAADPVIRRYAGALFVEHQLGGADRAQEIAKWLYPVIGKGSVAAFRTSLEMLSDAGDHPAIIKLAKQFPSAAGLPWQRELDIVAVVYGAAVVTGDRLARRLQRLLTNDLIEPAEAGAQRVTIAARLTPMGRISLLASAAELDRVQTTGDIWRDCGLIALGLFRALEMELNARLVRPLAAHLAIPSLISQLPANERALRALLQKLAGTQGGHGLSLGEIRTMLTKMTLVENENPQIAGVRDQVRSGFEAMLSDVGRRSLALDQIVLMVSATVIGRFRNPPAHGQFLRLDDAVAALAHVEDALNNVSTWLPATQ